MDKSIKSLNKDKCSGCMACFNICPVNAISMVSDEEGFKYPKIDTTKCTNCGLCKSSCQGYNSPPQNTLSSNYIAIFDDSTRLKSSSGGVFSAAANYFLENNGYVCAAAFDENWTVNHIIINDKKNLDKLRRSKYVQSNINKCYSEIKQLLNNDKLVLFVGCPCQVEGLRLFLKNKNYPTLYTMDLYCHNVPSPLVYEKLLDEYTEKENIESIDFRSKTSGWKNSSFVIKTKDGKTIKNENYVSAFCNGLFTRPVCYDCKFAKFPRTGDLTCADFWGVEEKFDDDKGTSILLVNNTQGEKLLSKIKNSFKILQEVPFLKLNSHINGAVKTPVHPSRKHFFKELENLTVTECIDKFMDKKRNIALYDLSYNDNYGAMFVGYAMQEILKSLQYNPYHINIDIKDKNSLYYSFVKKHFHLTQEYNKDTIKNINNDFDTYIVGSDQIWNPEIAFSYSQFREGHLLPFVNSDKKKIAYAASFGHESLEKWQHNYKFNAQSYYINQFDYVSVREFEGVKICEKYFHKKADKTLEPVLTANKEIWDRLSDLSNLDLKDKKYIATYFIKKNNEIEKISNYISKKLGYEIINIDFCDKKYTPEDFIYIFKNAKFVFTDSFHGTCFSLLYKKPFLTYCSKERTLSRFTTLNSLFNIQQRYLYRLEDLKQNENILYENPDFENIHKLIETEKTKSIEWLQKSIEGEKTVNYSPEYAMNEYYANLIPRIITLSMNIKKMERKYFIYKTLSKLSFGKSKQKYKKKAARYKQFRREFLWYLPSFKSIMKEGF